MRSALPRLRIHPDSQRVDEAMMRLAAAGRPFVDGSQFCSFSQFVERFEGPAFLKRRPGTPLAARIAVWAAARELPPGPFGSFVHEPAFARAALELFFDLKAGALWPSGFARAVEDVQPERRERARYLARLYAAYEAKLAALGLCDREDLLRGAVQRLEERGLPPFFQRFSAVELHDVFDFPPLRLELLVAFAKAADKAGLSVDVTVPASGAAEVDAVVDSALAQLERRLAESSHVVLAKADLVDRPLHGVGRALFASHGRREEAPPGVLKLSSVSSVRHEARHLARKVAEKLEGGCAPERIAVAYRDLGEEAEWLVAALSDLGIPARARRGAPLTSTAAGRAALLLPLVTDDDFPADAVGELLESRYLPALSKRCPDSPASLLALAAVRDDRIGAQGGKGAYQVRLGALAERLEAKGGSQNAVASRIRQLSDRCSFLFSTCRRMPAEGMASELLERWWSAVSELGLLDAARQMEERGQEGTAFGRAVLAALARDQAAIDALSSLTQELAGALRQAGMASQRMTRRTFHRWLMDAASDVNLTPRGVRGGAVQILDVRELVGRRFEHVLLGGLTDGRFPARDAPQPLFGDEDRAAVNGHHKRQVFRLGAGDLASSVPFRLSVDRLLFFLSLTSADRSVELCFAREAQPGRELLRSPFVDELCRVASLKVGALPAQPLPPLEECRNEEELRERVALEALAPKSLRTSVPDPAGPKLGERFVEEAWLKEASRLAAIEAERARFYSDAERPVGPHSGAAFAEEGDEAHAAALAEAFEFGPERPLSASLLGKIGNCGFQGFLAHALRLEEPDEPGEDLDSRGQGTFWHKVLEGLFPKLVAEGLHGKPPSEIPAELIDEAVDRAALVVEKTGHTGHPALWKLGRDRARAMVRRLLSAETRGLPFDGKLPASTELAFGGKATVPELAEVKIPAEREGEAPIWLEGKIDRVDEGAGGVAVVDYKSSVKGQKDLFDALLTTEFQLPVYLYALRASGQTAARDAVWLSLKDGDPVSLEAVLGKQTVEELLGTEAGVRARVEERHGKNLANALHELVGALRRGEFAARPEDCSRCGFRAICRISERRFREEPS